MQIQVPQMHRKDGTDTVTDIWIHVYMNGYAYDAGLTRPSRRTYNATSCACLGLWALVEGRGGEVDTVIKGS